MPDGGFPLAGCRVAFKVNISLEGIPPSDPKYQSIMDRVHHEEAANYSLSKLFMDLTGEIALLSCDHLAWCCESLFGSDSYDDHSRLIPKPLLTLT